MNALVTDLAPAFDVLGVPCNQFALQEPGANNEILNCYRYVRPGNDYQPLFELTEKVEVNGDAEHSLYTFLKGACPGTTDVIGDPSNFYWTPMKRDDVIWNFEKFLIGKDGRPVRRYDPTTLPATIKSDIQDLIDAK